MLKIFAFYLRASRAAVVGSVVTGLAAGAISAALMATVAMRVADPVSPAEGLLTLFAGLALLDLGATVLSSTLANYLAQNTSLDLRLRLSQKVLGAPLRQLEEIGSHRIIAVLTEDVGTIVNGLTNAPQLCIHVAVVVGCLAYLGWLSLSMLGLLVIVLGVGILTIKLPEARAKRHMRLARERREDVVGHIQALTGGAKELKLHRERREQFHGVLFRSAAEALRRHNVTFGNYYAALNGWGQILYFVIIGAILFAGPSIGPSVDARLLTAYAITMLYMRGHIIGIMALVPQFGQAAVSLRRVEELGLTLSTDMVAAPAGAATPTADPSVIELDGVTHSYFRERENASFVLGPVDLAVRRGELLFIVGGNGSGKTTLAKVLTGLYAPESGRVLVDGEPVAPEARDDYRQFFSAVFTDYYLFEQLLGLGGGGDLDDRARELLAELQLDHKVEVRDNALSTTKLSHGQRKRLALLTAFLEDRPFCVFDEWAAGQDPIFQEVFYLKILPELRARGKAVVVISHDDRYFHVADRLVKLDLGRVVPGQPLAAQPDAGTVSLAVAARMLGAPTRTDPARRAPDAGAAETKPTLRGEPNEHGRER